MIKTCCRLLQRENTGITQYQFYRGQRLLGTGSAWITQDFPLVLRCGGLLLNSTFDPDRTIVSGISRERVRQIEEQALKKLRNPAQAQMLRAFCG